VQTGHVVYVAAEGRGGLKARAVAWWQANGRPDMSHAHFLPEAVNLLDARHVAAARSTIATLPQQPVMLVVDTMARSMVGGDENSARDVGLFIAALDDQRITSTLVVHHTGKDGGSERGSTALRGAADVMALIERDGLAPTIELSCFKAPKDGEAWPTMTLRRELVDDSCVLGLVPIFEAYEKKAEELRKDVFSFIERNGPVSRNKVEKAVTGGGAAIRSAIDQLVVSGEVTESAGSNRTKVLQAVRLSLLDEPKTNHHTGTGGPCSSRRGGSPVGTPAKTNRPSPRVRLRLRTQDELPATCVAAAWPRSKTEGSASDADTTTTTRRRRHAEPTLHRRVGRRQGSCSRRQGHRLPSSTGRGDNRHGVDRRWHLRGTGGQGASGRLADGGAGEGAGRRADGRG